MLHGASWKFDDGVIQSIFHSKTLFAIMVDSVCTDWIENLNLF